MNNPLDLFAWKVRIFPEMVNQTVSKTVVDFFAGKSEAEIEKYIALCKQAEAFQKDK